MKSYEREEARHLRREQGLSVKEICKVLGVAKSSVSVWVRDIELTDEQREAVKARHPFHFAQHQGAKTNQTRTRERRLQYQEEGRAKARERDPLHLAGCMLYWAEGAKRKDSLIFCNSDSGMMEFYVKFLRKSLNVANDDMHVRVMCYTGNGLSVEEIESYWLDLLLLPKICLRKSGVNLQPRSSQQKGRKLLYGVCDLTVCRTQLVQHIFGAIQEYAGIEKPEWLF